MNLELLNAVRGAIGAEVLGVGLDKAERPGALFVAELYLPEILKRQDSKVSPPQNTDP